MTCPDRAVLSDFVARVSVGALFTLLSINPLHRAVSTANPTPWPEVSESRARNCTENSCSLGSRSPTSSLARV